MFKPWDHQPWRRWILSVLSIGTLLLLTSACSLADRWPLAGTQTEVSGGGEEHHGVELNGVGAKDDDSEPDNGDNGGQQKDSMEPTSGSDAPSDSLDQEGNGEGDEGNVPTEHVSVVVEVPSDYADSAASGRSLTVPAGFGAQLYASGLPGVRVLTVSPNGHLFASQPRSGRVVVLPDEDGDGAADRVVTVVQGLDRPHGLTFVGDTLYIAGTRQVWRIKGAAQWQDKELPFSGDDIEELISDLPDGGHWTRSIGLGPDERLYLSIGSSCNVCQEEDPRRGAILTYTLDGRGGTLFARGLRNAVGFDWEPEKGWLWAADNGRDGLGDDLPPEELNRVHPGAFYGWPFCYGDRQTDASMGAEHASRCENSLPPELTFPAHSAPLGIRFYTPSPLDLDEVMAPGMHRQISGTNDVETGATVAGDGSERSGVRFPKEYEGDLFVALHGSWDRSEPIGYKLIRVRFEDGQPIEWEDFASGWLEEDGEVWGRPVWPELLPDGSLVVSDDRGGSIFRFVYKGDMLTP